MLSLPPLPEGVRTLTNDEGARLRSIHPDLWADWHTSCLTCEGKGSFRWWRHVGGSRVEDEWECNCKDQWVLHRFLLNSGIGLNYQRLGWLDALSVEKGACDAVAEYVQSAPAYTSAGIGMILWGTNGNGKTLMATLLLKGMLAAGYDGYFTTFGDMLNMFASGWRDPEEQRWFLRRVKNAGVLVVDDVGKEGKRGSELPRSTFDEVIRHRVASARPTILTTNFDPADVAQSYGHSVMSLLRGSSLSHEFVGDDYRVEYRNSLVEDAKAGRRRPLVLA